MYQYTRLILYSSFSVLTPQVYLPSHTTNTLSRRETSKQASQHVEPPDHHHQCSPPALPHPFLPPPSRPRQPRHPCCWRGRGRPPRQLDRLPPRAGRGGARRRPAGRPCPRPRPRRPRCHGEPPLRKLAQRQRRHGQEPRRRPGPGRPQDARVLSRRARLQPRELLGHVWCLRL